MSKCIYTQEQFDKILKERNELSNENFKLKQQLKSNIIVISSYDGGFSWSMYVNDTVYCRRDVEKLEDENPIKKIFERYLGYEMADDIINEYFEYDTFIECEDGTVRIVKKGD